MIMKKLSVCIILSSLLTGCLGQWEHPTKRRSEFHADDRECQVLAGGVTQVQDPGGRERVSYEGCMWERGWVKKSDFWFFDPPPQ
jgi:hypothetical protein